MPQISKLPEGKLPTDILGQLLDSIEARGTVVPPSVGVDVGVTRTKGKFLVSSSDPITGTERKMGWHAVQVSANDVATSGIMPDALNIVSMFPPGTKGDQINSIMREVRMTAGKLGISVAGGHTELTPGLEKPILVVTCFGSGDKFVTAANARMGDSILMTKTAGIEGTSILARLPKMKKLVSRSILKRGADLIKKMSIVPEARAAFSTGRVNAMHDVTEGGVVGAVFEMSLASDLGFELWADAIPVDPSTREISKVAGVDPLKLIGSGALLVSARDLAARELEAAIKNRMIKCTRIGKFVSKKKDRQLISGRMKLYLKDTSGIKDELWGALRKFGT